MLNRLGSVTVSVTAASQARLPSLKVPELVHREKTGKGTRGIEVDHGARVLLPDNPGPRSHLAARRHIVVTTPSPALCSGLQCLGLRGRGSISCARKFDAGGAFGGDGCLWPGTWLMRIPTARQGHASRSRALAGLVCG